MATADARLWEEVKRANPGASTAEIGAKYRQHVAVKSPAWQRAQSGGGGGAPANVHTAPANVHTGSGGGSPAPSKPPPANNVAPLKPVMNDTKYMNKANDFKKWLGEFMDQAPPDIELPPGMSWDEMNKWLRADPAKMKVTPEMTSQYQLGRMLQSGNPAMRQAGYLADAASNRRGLLNTTIAQGARQGAMAETAAPYATQDAQAYFNAEAANVAAENQKTEFLRQMASSFAASDYSFKQNWETFKQSIEGKSVLMEQQFGYDRALAEQGGNIASNLQRQGYTESSQLADQQYQYQWELAKQGFSFDKELLSMQIAGQLEAAHIAANAQIDAIIASVASNPNLPPSVSAAAGPRVTAALSRSAGLPSAANSVVAANAARGGGTGGAGRGFGFV